MRDLKEADNSAMQKASLKSMKSLPTLKYAILGTGSLAGFLNFKEPREGDSGYDLTCSRPTTLFASEQLIVPTGLVLEIPRGYVGFIKERSSLAMRRIYVHAGVIDSSYRGEIGVVVSNLGESNYHFEEGDRVAQILFVPYGHFPIERVDLDKLSVTDRGDKGFGSTGK